MIQCIPSLFATSTQNLDPTTAGTMHAWYKADALGLADNATVTSFTDSSGNSRTLTNNNSTNLPINKTSILNGWPVLRFNGTNGTWLEKTSFNLAQPNTTFLVGKQTSKTTTAQFIESGTVPREGIALLSGSGFLELLAGNIVTGSTDFSGAFHIITCIFNGASSQGFVDGISQGVVDLGTGSQPTLRLATDGGTKSLTGDIAELIIYTGSMTLANRTIVWNYLKNKYAL